jgi:microcystin-dependent protein
MFKRFIAATLLLACSVLQTFAAGSLSLSLSQQFDSLGRPLSGGKLYFFQTGTSTPQNAYQDTALTLAHPNPMTLDSSGRIPAFYLADGSIKIRLADAAGVTILSYDGLLVVGASSGAGAAPSVDATTVLAVGDVKVKYGTGALGGFVRMNGRTIGSGTSGASERANSDAQTLFEYLWTADANLAVSGGRGASANADWLSNKTIALPDFRGRVPAALDDMGNSAAGRLTSTYFGASGIVLGNAGGGESYTLQAAETPVTSHTHAAGTLAYDHQVTVTVNGWGITGSPPGGGVSITQGRMVTGSGQVENTEQLESLRAAGNDQTFALGGSTATPTGSTASASAAAGGAHRTTQPTILVTYYIKL